jgi:ribosomal protein S18 acetylase RimI-like enzyme
LNLSVRRASHSDLEPLLALEAQFPGDRVSRASFRHWLEGANGDVWVAVAEFEGTLSVVGDALVAYRRGSDIARLMSLVSDPGQRRRGVAAALLAVAERAAMDRGMRRMRLEVRGDNTAAIALYQRAGYRMLAHLRGYYEDGADGWRMEKRLVAEPPA